VSNEFVALCDQEGIVCDMVHPVSGVDSLNCKKQLRK
jgi:hypothetical protein